MLAEACAVVDVSIVFSERWNSDATGFLGRARRFPITLAGFASLREEIFMGRILAAALMSLAVPLLGAAQTAHRVAICAGELIDGKERKANRKCAYPNRG
jgi:hypothetical protein